MSHDSAKKRHKKVGAVSMRYTAYMLSTPFLFLAIDVFMQQNKHPPTHTRSMSYYLRPTGWRLENTSTIHLVAFQKTWTLVGPSLAAEYTLMCILPFLVVVEL